MKQTITLLLIFFTGFLSAQTVSIQGGGSYPTIADAIFAAVPGDVILITGVHTGTFTVAKSITLRGTNPLTDIIQANGSPLTATTRVITLTGTPPTALNITIENLGIRNGNETAANANGGGINADKITGLVTLKNLIIENNKTAANGGAIGIAGSNVDIIECTLKNNISTLDGGAIIAAPNNGALVDNVVNIKQSLINANVGRNGGGIFAFGNNGFGNNYKMNINFINSTVSNNNATSASTGNGGGAIFSAGAVLTGNTISNITISLVHATFYNNFHAGLAKAGIQFGTLVPTIFSAYNSIIVAADDVNTKAFNFTNCNTTNLVNCIFGGTTLPPAILSAPVPNANNNEVGRTATYAGLTGTLSNEGGNTQVIKLNGVGRAENYCTVATPGVTIPIIDQRGYSRTGFFDAGAYESPLYTWTGATSTAWTGVTNWDNGVPISTSNVVIGTGPFQPTIASNVTIKSLTIATGATLDVTSGNLTVTGAIANSGTMTLENNANLIQGGTTNTNTGNVIVKRNSSPLLRLDYTLWSSPVTNAALYLKDFSPATLDTRFYNFNTTFSTGGVNGAYSAIASPSTTNFTAGKGYLIRMPDTADASTPTAYPGVFTGKPNNGTISVPIVDGLAAGLRYNLVGNPYPSPIKMQNLVFDNAANIESTLYFWRKTNGLGTAYCTWVAGALVTDPGTFVSNGNAQSVDPYDIIQTGQGFFVEAKSGATSLIFNNSQRIANNAGQFFKTKQVAEPSKIWLNATNATGDFSQMAITYFAEATLGVDVFDAKYFNDSPVALTSNIDNGEYTIQGRPAFDPSDVVALNFKTDKTGDYSIAIDHTSGLFATGQDVYLVDSKTGTETDLKAGAYTFNAASGVDNARFSLKYQKTLKVDASAFNENSVRVYKNNRSLTVNSGNVAMSNIKVFDIQGRLIAEQKNLKATTAVFNNLKTTHQVLIVKIAGEDNNVVTKKVVN